MVRSMYPLPGLCICYVDRTASCRLSWWGDGEMDRTDNRSGGDTLVLRAHKLQDMPRPEGIVQRTSYGSIKSFSFFVKVSVLKCLFYT